MPAALAPSELLGNIALSDPLSALLVLTGALLVGVSVLVMGYLTLGAVVEFVTPERRRGPSRRAR